MLLLPKDPGITTILHQFAIGLLGLPEDCPADWPCACNTLRARFNMTPPDHERPTDQFAISQLQELSRDYASRIRANDGRNGRTVTGLGYRAMPPVTPQSAADEWHEAMLEREKERDEQDTQQHQQPKIGSGPLE